MVAWAFGWVACASVNGVSLDVGDEITGGSGAYAMTLMAPGWQRIPPAETGYPGADLVLRHDQAGAVAVIHVHEKAETLDWIVLQRWQLVTATNEVVGFEEKRSFRPGPDYVAISIATYRLKTRRGWAPMRAAALRGDNAVIEVILLGGTAPLNESLFGDLVAGLVLPRAGGDAG